uniref:Long-distance movement protein n=1 Tax=Carrot mottle mimic virus TaxID=47736 RepID=B6UQC3_9TOMB|nr:long-distance movement protein [Carrot mottle mimic virus]
MGIVMNLQIQPINDGNNTSRNSRRTNQPSPRRGNTRQASGSWLWCPNTSPGLQYPNMYAALPPRTSTNSPGFLYPEMAHEAQWGPPVYREASGGILATRPGRNRGRGSIMAPRHGPIGPGTGRAKGVSEPQRGTAAGRFLSELLHSFERFGRECPAMFLPSDPDSRHPPEDWLQRLLPALNVESNHRREGAALPSNRAGVCAHCKALDKELVANTSTPAAISERRADEPARKESEGKPIHEAPSTGLCSKSHTSGEHCSDPTLHF